MELATLADVRVLVEKHLPKEYRAKFMWRLQRFRRRLWRRLQDRLRLWRLRRVWMLRMRPGLVGTLRRGVRCRDRVCCRCRLLHNLGRLPLLLGNRGGALLGVTWSRSRSRRHRPHSAAVRVAVKRERTGGLNRR